VLRPMGTSTPLLVRTLRRTKQSVPLCLSRTKRVFLRLTDEIALSTDEKQTVDSGCSPVYYCASGGSSYQPRIAELRRGAIVQQGDTNFFWNVAMSSSASTNLPEGGDHALLVNALYQTGLGRLADEVGLEINVRHLKAGTATARLHRFRIGTPRASVLSAATCTKPNNSQDSLCGCVARAKSRVLPPKPHR
jgi:hypothetical protein